MRARATTLVWLSLGFLNATQNIGRDRHALELGDTTNLEYDKLLIAGGDQALPLEVPGAELSGMLKLDHLEDAKHILKHARRGRTAVVIGGGITALELAEGLRTRGMKVHYLLRGDRYWSNVLDEHESKIVEHRLREDGITLYYHSELIEIMAKHGRVSGVRLLNGRTMQCDVVAYAIGIRPRVELAKQAGLAIDRGILVNEYLQTNDPDIFAAGDVAQAYDPMTGRSMLDSLWTPAREQRYAAGLNMAGKRTAYIKSVPFNVTRLAGLTTTIIGTVVPRVATVTSRRCEIRLVRPAMMATRRAKAKAVEEATIDRWTIGENSKESIF